MMQINGLGTNANDSGVKIAKNVALSSQDDAKLKAACKDMEAVFLNLLLAQMRKSIPEDGLLGKSSQEDIMQSMLDSEMTKNMAKTGGLGLADMLYRQLAPSVSPSATTNKNQAP